ncbi:MAG: STAS domain-containing protein [Sporichthyaceae bacterium]
MSTPELAVRRAGGIAVVSLAGDLDLSNTASLHAQLLDVLRARPAGMVIDLSEVTFCDLACLRTMSNLGRRAQSVGIWVRLAGPSPIVRRLLEITGLCACLPCFADVELALRGKSRPSVPAGRSSSVASGDDTRITPGAVRVYAATGQNEV